MLIRCLLSFTVVDGIGVKFVASTDWLLTWIDLYSLVDHFTIVPTFVGLYYDTSWIGQCSNCSQSQSHSSLSCKLTVISVKLVYDRLRIGDVLGI